MKQSSPNVDYYYKNQNNYKFNDNTSENSTINQNVEESDYNYINNNKVDQSTYYED